MDYDPQLDAIGSYYDAITAIGRRVRAGETAPATGYFAIPKPKEKTVARSKAYDQASAAKAAITPIEYSGLQAAYDHFNVDLFEGSLIDVFITYDRQANSQGYFAPDRFSSRVAGQSGRHGLALNPDAFLGRTDKQIVQILVHEMVHGWQHQYGKAAKRGYHNKQWSEKMKEIGLYPSSTGMVGGRETGQHMADYIIEDGPFSLSYDRLAAKGWRLNLQSAPRPGKAGGTNSKTKFTCGQCRQNVWGKPDAGVVCKFCDVDMLPETAAQAA